MGRSRRGADMGTRACRVGRPGRTGHGRRHGGGARPGAGCSRRTGRRRPGGLPGAAGPGLGPSAATPRPRRHDRPDRGAEPVHHRGRGHGHGRDRSVVAGGGSGDPRGGHRCSGSFRSGPWSYARRSCCSVDRAPTRSGRGRSTSTTPRTAGPTGTPTPAPAATRSAVAGRPRPRRPSRSGGTGTPSTIRSRLGSAACSGKRPTTVDSDPAELASDEVAPGRTPGSSSASRRPRVAPVLLDRGEATSHARGLQPRGRTASAAREPTFQIGRTGRAVRTDGFGERATLG